MTRKRGLGRLPDHYDPRDFLAPEPPTFARLPPSVDLRPKCSPVRDQGQQGSCTGFGAAALMEYRQIAAGQSLVVVSPAFIYWEERRLERSISNCDAGAMIRDAMKVLNTVGAASETDDPYSDVRCMAPSEKAVNDAKALTIPSYHRCRSLHALKLALSKGQGALLGIDVYESFESQQVARTGVVPLPLPGEALLGGHCILAVGYDDARGVVTCKNSWGTAWGDAGYFTLSYAYVGDHKLTSDIWTAP